MICYFFVERPIRFGAAVGALWLASYYVDYRKNLEERPAAHQRRLRPQLFRPPQNRARTRYVPHSARIVSRCVVRSTRTTTKPNQTEGEKNGIDPSSRRCGQEVPTYRMSNYKNDSGEEKFYYIHREYVSLVHGTTVHGLQQVQRERFDIAQALLPFASANVLDASVTTVFGGAGNAMLYPGRDPLTYYHRLGPVGSMFSAWSGRNNQKQNPNTSVACIGLGTGSLSSYGRPGQNMTFFEIDTHVRRLVEPPTYFSYIDSAKKQGVDIKFRMGDARISLERNNDKFGFMLVDAFSSDAIPAHLLTKQAVELYFNRLEDDGLLTFHISNRYLDLEPVVERLVREMNLKARIMHGRGDSPSLRKRDDAGDKPLDEHAWTGRYAATWIAIAKTDEALGAIEEDFKRWEAETNAAIDAEEKKDQTQFSRQGKG